MIGQTIDQRNLESAATEFQRRFHISDEDGRDQRPRGDISSGNVSQVNKFSLFCYGIGFLLTIYNNLVLSH